jgi:hypothetical protein
MAKSMRAALSNVATHRGNVPILKLLLGVLLVVFFLLALLLEIQTSEAFLLHGPAVTLAPNWGILQQPLELVQGGLPADMAKAVMWGWGIELTYLVCVVGEVSTHAGRLHGWFQTGALVLVAFNAWTNINYGTLASGVGGQLAFAGVTSFIVAFFGVIGINLIWNAILEFEH